MKTPDKGQDVLVRRSPKDVEVLSVIDSTSNQLGRAQTMRATNNKQIKEATERAPERTPYVRSTARELTPRCAVER